MLALALLAGLLASGVQWWWMVLAPLLLHGTRLLIHHAFARTLRPEALYLWSERVGIRLTLLLLTALHVVAALYLPQPDLGGVPFAEAASRVLGDSAARSGLVVLLQVVGDLPFFLYQWSVQQVITDGAPYWWVVTGWLAILAQGAVVYWPVLELSLAVQRSAGPVAAGTTP